MNRENKRKSFEKGYYKTHACNEAFTCKVCGRPFTPASMQDSCCSPSCEAAHARASGRGALFDDPWASGAIPPDRYDRDFYRIPDTVLGF